MCLNGVFVPRRLPHPGSAGARPDFSGVGVECGGDGGAQHDALPQSAWSVVRATQKGGRQVVMSSPPGDRRILRRGVVRVS
jgi:hypothetical protein